jgi:hypothetical protein
LVFVSLGVPMPCPICRKEHSSDIPELLKRLAAASRRVERTAASITSRRASTRPAPGKWSAQEIICHLADCELVYGVRYRIILSEPDPVLIPFDQDAWAANLQYRNQSVKAALAAFCALKNSRGGLQAAPTLMRSLPGRRGACGCAMDAAACAAPSPRSGGCARA